MKNNESNQLKIIGKVDAVNQGLTYYNTTIFDVNKKAINIKLREDVDKVITGQIYEFTVLKEDREDRPGDYILNCLNIKPVEDIMDVPELTELYLNFYEYAPLDAKELKNQIEQFIRAIKNKTLSKIIDALYKEYKNRFYIHPAATKFHHAYIGGLAYHTLNMLKISKHMINIYPYLNADLMYAGILIHDICKIDEMTGVDGEYTEEGLLLGHIVMGASKIDEVARKLKLEDTEEVLLLKHIIVGHHGQLIFGSPRKPQIAEALMIWYIDTIDSKFQVIGEVLDQTVDQTFTNAIPVADKTRFYKHKLTKTKE